MGRTLSPKQTALLLDPKPMATVLSTDDIPSSSYGSPRSKNSSASYMDKFAKTDAEAMAKIVKQRQLEKNQGPQSSLITSAKQ